MANNRHIELANFLVQNNDQALALFSQLHEQYRSLVVHPNEKRGGGIVEKYLDGIVFSELSANGMLIDLLLRVPRSACVLFCEEDSTEPIEIPFTFLSRALQECEDKAVNDSNWHVAFDRQVLVKAITAIETSNAKNVYDASKEIEEQVARLERANQSIELSVSELRSELSEIDKSLLNKMYELKCFDNESKKTTPVIVRAISRSLDYNSSFKRSGASLQKTNPPLIQKADKGHGYWLTHAGIEVCKLLMQPKN